MKNIVLHKPTTMRSLHANAKELIDIKKEKVIWKPQNMLARKQINDFPFCEARKP